MRAPACFVMMLLVGCSSVLGIDDPKPAGNDDGGPPPDVATTSTDRLTVSLADVKLAQGQRVRIHVQLVHLDGTMQDVTASATFTSDDTAIATSGGPGLIDGGSKVGTATITANLGAATPATVKATVTTAMCHPVINELTTGTAASAANEWVEVYNPCTNAVDVNNWTLVYRGAMTIGGTDSALLRTLTGSMAPGELRLFAGATYAGANDGTFTAGSGLAQTDGAVGLRAGAKDTGLLMDSIAYGDPMVNLDPLHPFIEGTPAPVMANGKSASRKLFDGNDTNDNAADFVIQTTATPRALNVP